MKNFNLILAFLTGFIMFQNVGYSQEQFKCGLPNRMNALFEEFPDLEREHLELQQQLIENSRTYYASGDREGEALVIPVVFHILHENGTENISDAQIYNQMDILNRDFRKLNADTVDVIDEFKALVADVNVEFRLATKDPFGNCTNGILRTYSHETNNGDDYSKFVQWPRGRYLNVWVVRSMRDGVAGYTYQPSTVGSPGQIFRDGIIIRHNYIGSIGTGSPGQSRALTHEIGHWLGLDHTWGGTNEPEVACGNDGVDDTPITAGHSSCPLFDADCNDTIIENIQNYMEYSYCSNMFTLGQSALMNTSLVNDLALRNNLHAEANRIATGTWDDEPVLCSPLPDFYTDKDIICAGSSIKFNAAVTRAQVDTYEWYFPGGTPSTSAEMSPEVTYETPGVHDAQLTVTNAAGSETIIKTQYVYALGDYWKYNGPHSENFETGGFEDDNWIVLNPENNSVKWKAIDHAGFSGTNCVGLEYFKASPDPFEEPFYYKGMGGTKDVLISPSFNLNNTTGGTLSFKYIYATTNAGVFDPTALNLRVSYWKDCSASWSFLNNISANDLICVGHKADAFYPDGSEAWQSVNIPLSGAVAGSNVRFKFEFTAEDFSNNFFMDDINISGTLSDGREDINLQNVSLYPNPSASDQIINLSYYSTNNSPLEVQIYDMLGNLVYATSYSSVTGINTHEINLSSDNVSKGVYNVVMSNSTQSCTKRLILN